VTSSLSLLKHNDCDLEGKRADFAMTVLQVHDKDEQVIIKT
jgi:hypothetical protein